ncbi:MAG: cytochrome P450 [Acidobacteria bacterium]|nr:cytochrome P450 [Acidobacteriota bacterium]
MSIPRYPARSFVSARRGVDDPLAFLQSLAASGCDVVEFTLGRRRAFLLNHPRYVEDVLVRGSASFPKGRGYERAGRLLGSGLLTASGSVHTERRRLTYAAFHRHRIPRYGSTMVAHAERRRDRWRGGVAIDLAVEMRELALGIASEALFGVDLTDRAEQIHRIVSTALPAMDGLLAVVATSRRIGAGARELRAIVDEVVQARRESGERRDDLLALLLDALEDTGEASRRQLQDDAVTFLMAGHDSVAHAMTWTWILLADHAEIDVRLGRELEAVLEGRLPTSDDLPRLTFTRAVFAESMRVFPPAWVIVRSAAVSSRCGDVEIPAGSIVVASPFLMHRDPRFFRTPASFDPDRWLDGSMPGGADRPRLAYFPFGAGPRSCIGEGFAWMEGTLALATFAQRWRLTRMDGEPGVPVPKITLRPKGPVLLRPEPRAAAPVA